MTTPPDDTEGPFRDHVTVSIGSGVFAAVTKSDGLAPYSESWLRSNGHFRIQRIRREEQPSGCDTVVYDVEQVWVSSGRAASVTVDGAWAGDITSITAAQRHGYVAPLRVRRGNVFCVSPAPAEGFHLIFGPDLYYHYDSYCFRGHC